MTMQSGDESTEAQAHTNLRKLLHTLRRGLPALQTVAIDDFDPDIVVVATRNRLYLSRDGGLFWTALAVELPEINALALREA